MKSSPLLFRAVREVAIRRINGSAAFEDTDFLAAEEPLEIRVEGQSVAIVMRTPGEDRELAAGFLVTEGLAHDAGDLVEISHRPHCALPGRDGHGPIEERDGNVIDVRLKHPESLDLKKLTRHVFTSSSCGICSKASIEAVRQQFPPVEDHCHVEPQVLLGLPRLLASAQDTFKRTGGLHACALFDLTGKLVVLREDVGRHNALDKLAGWALLADRLPLRQHVLLLSGRASFEMMQKALAAGVPIVAAVSAPSSLAAEFARESGQTLVGFLRGDRMNIYAGAGPRAPDPSDGIDVPVKKIVNLGSEWGEARRLYIAAGHNFFGRHGQPPGENPIIEVAEIECVAGRGLRGDRFFDFKENYKGQITFFAWETYEAICRELDVRDRAPSVFRRNVITTGVDLNEFIGREFRIQGVHFRGTEECRPCYWMDQAFAPGANEFLKGRGGLRAVILSDGILRTKNP